MYSFIAKSDLLLFCLNCPSVGLAAYKYNTTDWPSLPILYTLHLWYYLLLPAPKLHAHISQ